MRHSLIFLGGFLIGASQPTLWQAVMLAVGVVLVVELWNE